MKRCILFIFFSTVSFIGCGQRLNELLQEAEKNYPLLKAKQYDVQSGREKVLQEKSSVIPTLDAAYQLNYATYNNITGMASGQYFVPISGPPSVGNEYDAVFGSVGSLLLNWEPFTFGQRSSRVRLAKANLDYQQADAAQEIFSHQIKVANAYLDLIMINELIKVHEKNLDRADENLRIVRSLTTSGLRPGVDTALFNAEVSRARIDLLTYKKHLETQKISFSELLGTSKTVYDIDSSFFDTLPQQSTDTALNNHPLVRLSAAKLLVNSREKSVLQRTLNPKLSLWGTAYGRG